MSRGIEVYFHYLLIFLVAFFGSMAADELAISPRWAFVAGAITMVLVYGVEDMVTVWLQADHPEVDDE